MRARTAVALTGLALVGLVVIVSWLIPDRAPSPLQGETRQGETLRLASESQWVGGYRAPEVTTNGVTLAGKQMGINGVRNMKVDFWLLVKDASLQDFQVRPVGVSLHTKETEYGFNGGGTLLAAAGIHFGSASFGGYDYASSHPNVPGRNKELNLSIQSLEVLNPDGSVQKVIAGPWETVVAVRNDVVGGPDGSGYGLAMGEFSQSQFGVTVQLSKNSWGYDVVQNDQVIRTIYVQSSITGPYVISEAEYQQREKEEQEYMALRRQLAKMTPQPAGPTATSGPVGLGSQTGNAIVEVGSFSIPQGQQAQVAVTVKGVNDPDGLGAYVFGITYDPAVVNVMSVSGGQAPFDAPPTKNINNIIGQVVITGSHGKIPGPTGDIVVAYVTLKVVGPPGSAPLLDISVFSLLETAAADPIPAVDQDGTVTIAP